MRLVSLSEPTKKARTLALAQFDSKLSGLDHDVSVFAFTLGFRNQAGLCHQVVHDLALVRRHRLHVHRLIEVSDLVDDASDDAGNVIRALLARAANIQDESAEGVGLDLNGQAGELLQRLDGLRVGDQRNVALGVFRLNGNVRAALANVDVDVAIEVKDIQKLFEVVGGDFALFLEALNAALLALALALGGLLGCVVRCLLGRNLWGLVLHV